MQRDRRTEVWLLRDEHERNRRERASDEQIDARDDAPPALAEELGEHQRQEPPWRTPMAAD